MQYYHLIKDMSKIKFNLRLQMVVKAQNTSISEAARFYGTTRVTVRKWLKRYKKYGLDGIRDLKRAPKHIPHKLKPEDEARIIELRQKHPSWGPLRLLERYHIKGSNGSVNRVIKQNGLIKPKKRRWRKRKDLSELKKKMLFFENSQIDTKDLSDIYQYWPYMKRLGLPRYEYTLRELSTGATFYAYANENNSTYASLFAKYVIEHLASYGINTLRTSWQTDNAWNLLVQSEKR